MTTRFDRWTAAAVIVLWPALLIARAHGLTEYGSWGNVGGGVIAIVVGSLAVVQMLRQRRQQDSATELHLNPRDTK